MSSLASTVLFESSNHKNVLLPEFGRGLAVQANQHLIMHGQAGIILDPGGHKVYGKASSECMFQLGTRKMKYIFFSHQDPDIIAAANGWLMTTDAEAYISALWLRFVPHFGLDELVSHRLKPIPDEGLTLDLDGAKLMLLPAHFLHSEGNFQVYDPVSKILYTGDLGASLGMEYREVPDFDAHLKYMEGFHRRYMVSRSVLKAWASMVRQLEIEIIAPQHGALFRGKAMCGQLLSWLEDLECGIDLMLDAYRLPAA